MIRLLALVSLLALAGCEPCAVVFGSHCQDRQKEEDQDEDPFWGRGQQASPMGQVFPPPPPRPRG